MIRFALRTPYSILVVALMMVVLGVFAMLRMPLDILPTFQLPAVMVVTTYTGMPAEAMEMDITNRLERWLSQAAGLDHMESRSMIGVSVLDCFFEPGFDPNNALAQISTLVMSDLHYLPPGTQPPIVVGYDPTASLPVGLLSVFTPGLGEAKLWDESNYIVRTELNAVPGAVAPVVFGGKYRQIMVYMQPDELVGHQESPLNVVDALTGGNAMVPTGDVKIGDTDFSMTSNGMVPNLKAFDQLPIRVTDNAPVLIRDIGEARDAAAIQTNQVQVNGVLETYIPLFRRIGASTLRVVDNIRSAIPAVLSKLPDGSRLKLVFDQSPKIRDAISDVVRELVVGVALAALVIYFFLGSLIPTVIASLTIPLSILGGMLALYYCGQSLNLMTLGGLALVTGPLIDMAVVALENIERHLDNGAPPADAAEKGTSEVRLPVLMSALALVVVFYPVTFFQGLGKFLFFPMALAVAATELLSYISAMTVVPLLAARLFKPKEPKETVRATAWFNAAFSVFRARYGKALGYAIEQPRVVVALTVLMLVGALCLLPMIGTEFFPSADNGQFFLRMRAKTGLRIEKTSELVTQVSKAIVGLLPKDSVDTVLANTGVIPSWAAAYSPNSASHDALLEVGLSGKSPIGAVKAIKQLRHGLASNFAGTHFSFSLIDPVASALNYGALSPIDLRIVSPKLGEGARLSAELLAKIQGVRGIRDAFVEQKLDYPSIHLEVDRVKAAYLGFSATDVVDNVITALNSSVLFSPNFWDDPASGNNYFIGAMYPEKEIDSLDTIENIPLFPRSKLHPIANVSQYSAIPLNGEAPSPTLLRNLASLSYETIPVEITHLNIERVFDIIANIEDRDIGGVASDIDRIVARTSLPEGYTVKWSGQVDSMRSSFRSMGGGMVLSLILIFLLMVAQLKSLTDPLLILATVPMGFVGVFWMLFLTNTTFNIQSLMGMIMLIGIVVSNTVILTDFANKRFEAGVAPKQAIREAGLTRLRPILMTAICTVMALLPSALGGANAPLARAVIGGLLTSTFLSLLFLPALYVLVKARPGGAS